ncbi:MAG: hypothetical protein NTY38_01325 [Acidobacteria bacterium]|nr:hypothetical protein [Acidobacteriota bacterium]
MRFVRVLLFAVCLPVISAPPAITEEQVRDWVRVWQQRLKLDQWNIQTRIVRASELKPDTLGNCKWDSEKRTALIRVLDPADYDLPATAIPSDIEFTVVHELVHLQLSALPRDPKRRNVEEDVVNGITDALVNLDRNRAQASVKR